MSTPPQSDAPPPPMPQLGAEPTPLFRPLTKLERLVLTRYREQYTVPPTLGGLYRRSTTHIAILLGGAAVILLLTSLIRFTALGWLFLGFSLGALVNTHGIFRQALLIWPLSRVIINWQAVEALLAGDMAAARAAADKVAPNKDR